ncbi:hypothetical protein [Anaeromyxobacter paludicola]|uniref:Lipoprotein n=1 Tax=Anaeromyxobacter paludicola TaxID=2918171 RepID=A0ABN6NCM8_9BACT|nr:hypothetical protein [Anaeromyxobacter paludicola]BDG09780.1 hypothetical protein AMPC_28930 [Anaeromyxobacter paludicola]
MRVLRPFAAAAALLALAACGKSACEQLGNRICSCEATSLQDSCNNAVKNQLSTQSPSSADEASCQALLATCLGSDSPGFCDTIKTPAGKVACGEAWTASP